MLTYCHKLWLHSSLALISLLYLLFSKLSHFCRLTSEVAMLVQVFKSCHTAGSNSARLHLSPHFFLPLYSFDYLLLGPELYVTDLLLLELEL